MLIEMMKVMYVRFVVVITASEIQTIQIGEGNVCRGLPIPIFMIFPRLFSCPTVCTTNFKIGSSIYISFS